MLALQAAVVDVEEIVADAVAAITAAPTRRKERSLRQQGHPRSSRQPGHPALSVVLADVVE